MHSYQLLTFSFYDLVYFFAIYSFLGWCTEVTYYFKKERKFVNRGFLYGPFCPIYGFCLVFIIILLDRFKNNLVMLFILAFFLTSFVEYFTGLILEKVFKSKWWDYTEDPLNLHGRICLGYSLIWGIASVAVIKIIHPFIEYIINIIPSFVGNIIFYGVLVYFITDFTFTLLSLIKFKHILLNLQTEVDSLISRNSDSSNAHKAINSVKSKVMETTQILENITNKAISNVKEIENPLSRFKLTINHTRLINAFPNLSSKSFGSILKLLKDKLKKD